MSSSSARAPKKISVEEFIRQINFTKGQDIILAACYYAEIITGQSNFGMADIEALITEAKLPLPGNLSRDLRTLADRKKKYLSVVKGAPGPGLRYTLTTFGADAINTRMQEVGLTISKPTERTELIKEVTELLHERIQEIPDKDQREYIEEAISCLSPVNNAPRAAIVMAWAGTVYNLRQKIHKQGPAGYARFTTLLQAGYKQYKKPLTTFNDLEDIKDVELLDICEKMDIVKGKSVKKQLEHCLDLRNGVGHPTNVRPGPIRVKAFFEDIIEYVLAVT
jgi:hypothetical protein